MEKFVTTACALACAIIALGSAAPARAADTVSVGVVSLGSSLQWPLWIVIDKGFAQQENLVIDAVAASGTVNLLQQIAAGALHLGLPAAGDSFRAIDKGAKVKIIRTDVERVPHTLVAKAEIKSFAHLKGKIISIGAAQGLDRVYLDQKLKSAGLAPGQYDVIGAGATANRFSALLSGAIDAAALSAPFNFEAVARGYNDLGTVDFEHEHFPFSVYVAYAPWLEKNSAVAVRYLRAYARAVNWFLDPANRAEAVAILLRWGKGEVRHAEAAYDLYQKNRYFEPAGGMSDRDLARFIDVLAQAGYVEGARDPGRFFDRTLVDQAARATAAGATK